MRTRYLQSTAVARPMASAGQRTVGRAFEKPINFVLNLPQAQSVALVGTFNNWELKRTPMRKDLVGGWKTTIWLPKGRYEYRFIADGQWLTDPNAAGSVRNPFGTTNSVLVV